MILEYRKYQVFEKLKRRAKAEAKEKAKVGEKQ
jgi:hypothetical protein